MKRSLMLLMAVALSTTACSEKTSSVLPGPIDRKQPNLPSPSMQTIAGRISVTFSGDERLVEVRDSFNSAYRLTGSAAADLASINGGDVIVRGIYDADTGLDVQDFQVSGMYGRAALDGVLELTDDGFALRLIDGSLRVVPGMTSDCSEYVGSRLWVVGWEEGWELQVGLIGAVQFT
jgi:hypothetical protein